MRKILLILLSMVFVSCTNLTGYKKKLDINCSNREPYKVEIKQYNKALFNLDTTNFAEEVLSLHNDFPELIPTRLDEEQINYLKLFVTDTFCLRINEMVERKFTDIAQIEDDVKSVYQHLNYYFPEIPVLPTYTYVSGIDMSSGPVIVADNCVMISLDYYLGGRGLIYDYVGMPRFMSVRCQSAAIGRDVAMSLYDKYLDQGLITKDILSEMVERGKMYYFVEAMVPGVADSILLGYSARQMEWANENEGLIWASVVGNKILYSNNLELKRKFFNDGPFTAAFSEESPARLGDFLGLQIVRSFMSSNDIALTNLLNISDEQEIFQKSQYKPKKR